MLSAKLQEIQCKKWAKDGEAFSEELYDGNVEFYNLLKSKYSYFSIANGIALTWTKHAKYEFPFVEMAAAYLDGLRSISLADVDPFRYRFGTESLFTSLQGIRSYKNKIQKIIPDFTICSAKEIKKFQDSSFTRLANMKANEEAYGVGPWLFLGPFKIILGLEKRLWNNPEIDSVILPTGIEVNRGIRRIIKAGYPVSKTFDVNWLENEERTLEEGYTIDTLIQNTLLEIAKIGGTRVIHVNSAFYLYGAE